MSLTASGRISKEPVARSPRNRLYQGTWSKSGGCRVTVNGEPLRHIVCHSPDGFRWGYSGSGPADLALALLADATGQELAIRYHQAFKRERIATLAAEDDWTMTRTSILDWLQRHILAQPRWLRGLHGPETIPEEVTA